MESASSAASGNGQQHVQMSAADVKGEPPTGTHLEIDAGKRGALPSIMEANTRRSIVDETSPAQTQPSSSTATITTQEESVRYRGKAMRIASVEQDELGSIMEVSVSGHVLKWARQ